MHERSRVLVANERINACFVVNRLPLSYLTASSLHGGHDLPRKPRVRSSCRLVNRNLDHLMQDRDAS